MGVFLIYINPKMTANLDIQSNRDGHTQSSSSRQVINIVLIGLCSLLPRTQLSICVNDIHQTIYHKYKTELGDN